MAITRTARLTASALLAASGMALPAFAQSPHGGHVVAGSATINQNGNFTGITASNGAIINWQSFNIGQGQTVQFFQPTSSSRVLNRVSGSDPSRIAGNLVSNGIVYITNAAGVFFAHGSLVNVGGIYASAGNISNADFLAGRNHFTNVQGVVQNDGVINSPAAHLVGQHVANYGSINAPNGMVTMTAGSDVYIGEQGGQVFARISGTPASGGTGVTQAGQINAAGGQVRLGAGDMYAVAIDHPGSTVARNITLQGGRGGEDPNVNGGIVSVTGTLDASDHAAGHSGGTVKVLGDRVGVFGYGTVDASGDAGGGTILVGGNRQGQGPETNSQATYVGVDATLRADAANSGSGGTVIVWSDGLTRAYGHISAHGFDFGGFVETSARHELQIMRTPDINASRGRSGTWLIDPDDLTFAPAGTGNTGIVTSGTTVFTSSGAGALLDVGVLEAALTGGATVEVRTGASANAAGGTITLPSGVVIDYDGTGSNTLSLFAHRGIVLDGQIIDSNTGTADSLNLNLTADVDLDGTGGIAIHNVIDTGGGSFSVLRAMDFDNTGGTITTHGGNVDITLATSTSIATLGADINAGSGSITLNPDVVLGADVTLTGANVTFARTINSDSTARQLNVSLIGPGLARFFGRIGSVQPLSGLSVSSAGNAGTTRLAAGSIAVTGDVDFSDNVQLVTDNTISADNVTFARTIDSSIVAHALNIMLTGSGFTRLFGAIGSGTALSSLSIDSVTHHGTTRLSAGSVTTTGAQTYGQDVVLLRDTAITSGGAVTFARRVDSDATARDLTIDTSGNSDTRFFGLVGSVSALDAFTTNADGTTQINAAGLTAATATFGDNLFIGADTTISGSTSLVFSGDVNARDGQTHDLHLISPSTSFFGRVGLGAGGSLHTLSTAAGGTTFLHGSGVSARFVDFGNAVVLDTDVSMFGGVYVVFRSTVDSSAGDGNSLSVSAPTINFNGPVGAAAADTMLGTLATSTGVTTLNAGSLFADVFNFNNAVVLANNTTINATTSVRFGAELDSREGLFRNLTINSPDTTFAGVVGGGSGGTLGVLTTDAAGTTTISSGAMTANIVQFNDAVVLGADCVLTGVSSVTFASTLDSVSGQGNDLTINSPSTTFAAVVGGTAGTELGALITQGGVNINADISAQSMNFGGAAVLGADITLTAPNSVEFGSTVASATGHAYDLTVNSLVTTFTGAVGSPSNALGVLTTDAAGATTFGDAIIAGSIVLNDNVTFNGGTISTSGDQTFGGNLTLGADTTLAGHNITFNLSVDSSGSDHSLIINTSGNGDTVFNGAVGVILPLASLQTNADGRTILNGGILFTSGDQTYHDAITLGITTVINANNIDFESTIDSDTLARSLTVNSTGDGVTTFNAAIGSSHHLDSLITNSNGATKIKSGTIDADGTIAFNDAVTLSADTTLSGAGVAFGGTLDSDFSNWALVVNTSNNGVTAFNGAVGARSALASIVTNQDGSTQFFGASIKTTGDQSYHDAVSLGHDCVINAENITFDSTINSTPLLPAAGLTLNSQNSGTTTFSGAIGGTAPLSFLTTDASGVTKIGANITTSGSGMTFNDTVRLTSDVTLTDSGTTGINFGGTLDSEGSARALTLLIEPPATRPRRIPASPTSASRGTSARPLRSRR